VKHYEGLEEVKTAVSEATANKLLKEGWKLLAITGEKTFVFGRFAGQQVKEPSPGSPPVTGDRPLVGSSDDTFT
jgi:hypothetical protein